MLPRRITGPGGAAFELDEDLVAIHGDAPACTPDNAVATFEDGSIVVLPANAPTRDAAAGGAVGPVYRAAGGGPIAVPTGRVFVRFGEGTRAEDRADELGAAGFAVESVPGYAPQAAWLRARSGRLTDALGDLDAVRGLPGVELVEPQLVAEAARRGNP